MGVTTFLWAGWFVLSLIFGGRCEQPELVQNFVSKKYLGRWYEIYREKSVPFEQEDCATATYRELDGNFIEVNNIEYNIAESKWAAENPTKPADAQCSAFRSGHCQVKFVWVQPWSDYKILYTDYTTHSVVYGCDTFVGGMVKFDWLWALTRVPNAIGSAAHTALTNTVFAVINSKLEDFGDVNTRLRPT